MAFLSNPINRPLQALPNAGSRKETPSMPEEEEEEEHMLTVTVIGGCGFLGQHLIRLLQMYCSNVSLIKVLDLYPFKPELPDYHNQKKVQGIQGTVTCLEDLRAATAGATTVFHLASFTDRSMFPDTHFFKFINVHGTENVIKACQENGVKNLIYASDISAVMGPLPIRHGNEMTTSYPRVHLLPDGPSKATAEKMVMDANGTPTKGNSDEKGPPRLRTVCLRPVKLFGELDSLLLPRLVRMATANDGHLPCVGTHMSKAHLMYVGNAAWAFICAHETLCHRNPNQTRDLAEALHGSSSTLGSESSYDRFPTTRQEKYAASAASKQQKGGWKTPVPTPESAETSRSGSLLGEEQARLVEGKAFFVTDNTPPVNCFVFMKGILSRYGFFLTSWALPEKWAKRLYKLVYILLWLLFPLVHINPPVSEGEIHELCHRYSFSKKLARAQLNYTPIFPFKNALHRTVTFYDKEYKEAMAGCLVDQALDSQHISTVRRMSTVKRNVLDMDMGDTGKRFRGKAAKDPWKTLK
ncbi:3 beta-hydroxysteroid dehydrogenase/Delta 5--_4-isomerase-like [Babylonia areolata]|uniref:3 beta-hydroxysteroid dehydrogenase/Delta 5-->4-isomerase-like n=1 Tax=Babylonia areolata TaxID=304850 RepID=UPI003FD2F8BB